MEVAAYLFGLLAVIIGYLMSNADNRDTKNWLACSGIVCGVIGGFCWYQDYLWKKDDQIAIDPSLRIEQLDKRAYMGAGRPELKKFRVGKSVDCTVTFVNTGKTPARLVEDSIGILILAADTELTDMGNSDMQRMENLPVKATIHPRQPMSIKDTKPPTITKELLANLNNGTQKLFVTSAVYYRDVIEDKLRTERICYYWDRHAKVLYAHEKGNHSD